MSINNPLHLNGKGTTADRLTALENVVNALTDEMYEKRIKQAQADIKATNGTLATVNESQAIVFAVTAEAGAIDEQTAVKHKENFEEWKADTTYVVGNMRRAFDAEGVEHLYKCKSEHTSQEIYPPYLAVAEWDVIDVEHAGTVEDPIPFVTGMEVFNGKYYTYDEVLYLCTRDSGQALYNTPNELIDIYFVAVE